MARRCLSTSALHRDTRRAGTRRRSRGRAGTGTARLHPRQRRAQNLRALRIFMPANPAPKGVIFDLFHTLTGLESQWSDLPATCEVLGIDRRRWDEVVNENARWRFVGEVR